MAESQRSDLEMLIALSRALKQPAPLDERFAASVLRRLGSAGRDMSLWGLGRGQGIPFVDAMATVGRLVESGLVERAPGPMPDCVRLTEAGQSLVAGLGLAGVRAAQPGVAEPAELFAAARRLDTAPAATVPDASCRAVMSALLDYSDQPISRIAKRTGLSILDVSAVMRAFTACELAVLQRSSSDERARLTADGRRLALRLAGRGSSLPGVA